MGIAILAVAFLPGHFGQYHSPCDESHAVHGSLSRFASPGWIAAAVGSIMAIDFILLALAIARFKRSKLMYD